MKSARWLAPVVAPVLLLSGCGTVCNLASGDPDRYGGVQFDLAGLHELSKPGEGLCPSGTDGRGAIFLLAATACELSLTFVADTLTLPLVDRMQGKKRPRHDEPVPTTNLGDPANAASRPDWTNPLDWGDAEALAAERKARWAAQEKQPEAPPGGPHLEVPPLFVPPPLSPDGATDQAHAARK